MPDARGIVVRTLFLFASSSDSPIFSGQTLNAIVSIFTSSIGRKWIVAVSGVVLFAYVIGHLAGNLQFFIGPDSINRYGAFLHSTGELLWIVRLGLLLVLVLHVVFTIKLRLESRAARPARYAVEKRVRATLAARWMLLSGLTVLCFVIYHLLHFTAQVPAVNLTGVDFAHLEDSEHRHDVFKMMVLGFSNKAASAFYVVGVGLLAVHLNHGFQSMFQTLGLNTAKLAPCWTRTGQVLSWLIFIGYASIPVAVFFGYGKYYGQ